MHEQSERSEPTTNHSKGRWVIPGFLLLKMLRQSEDSQTTIFKGESKHKKNPLSRMDKGFSYGVPGGIRTPDLLIRSLALYPAELQVLTAEISYNIRLQ